MFVLNCMCVCVCVSFFVCLIRSRKNGWPDSSPVRDKKLARNCGLNPEVENYLVESAVD